MALFVANWKMYKPYEESIQFAQEYGDELSQLSTNKNKIVIAPSFLCLNPFNTLFQETRVRLCAQDLAPYSSGAYTGEVDASSLAEIGCAYAIIGHSERRKYFHETDEIIAQKTALAFANNIIPIVCIGETQEEFEEGRTIEVLAMQLERLIKILDDEQKAYCIAYEPMWAIGTGKVPNKEDLKNTFEWIFNRLRHEHCTLLYGGSVTEKNAEMLLQIPHVGGLLIGKASCDFQSLKKIVSLG